MKALEIITKKRDGWKLSAAEINFLVAGYTTGLIPDYQMASFLMAVYFQGLDFQETVSLTAAMARSGNVLPLKDLKRMVIDKHSTGGVGDGISLALAPLVAAAGLPVLMMSGRGLGHTGGTLDKLESIPGFRTDLSSTRALNQVKKIGLAMIGQTTEFAPADKKIYALRDATGTVENISLICASILSKKIAAGIDGLVLDVKCGNGAFIPSFAAAKKLARTLIIIGKKNGLKIKALITDMNQPLGKAIGNSLEIAQALEVLRGNGPADFEELTLRLGAEMMVLGKKTNNISAAKQRLQTLIHNGQALSKFYQLVKAQGGDLARIPVAKHKVEINSPWKGYLFSMNTKEIGLVATLLGAGRQRKEDSIDHSAGIILHKKLGDPLRLGEPLATLYYHQAIPIDELKKRFIKAVKSKAIKPKNRPLIYKVLA
ncbi:MAG: thymidine phosphorylase [Elusimicrobia bacterium]|nr:thymidine phosphorylase [Elusimicrobiota bacterium]